MRLLFVGTRPGGGGTEMHLVELARALADAGHEVAAVVKPGGFIEYGLREHGGVQYYEGHFDRSTEPAGTLAVWKAARQFRPEWIFSSFRKEYYSVALVGRLQNVGIGFFEHSDLPTHRPWTNYVVRRICDQMFVPSEYLRQHLIERGVAPARIHVVHNPVDTERLRPNETLRRDIRNRLGFAEGDAVVVGFVGRIEEPKGVHVLVAALNNAMRHNARLRALWIGDGAWSNELDRAIQESGFTTRHVRTGWVDDVTSYYSAMDILALPTTRSETFGRVLTEAQSCGVPVLGSDLAGIVEAMIPGTTGLLLPPGDVAAWTKALLQMANESARAGLGEAGRSFVQENFSAPHVAEKFVNLLQACRRK